MSKIVILDGGPRKTMNTAQMIEAFKQGVQSVSDQIEIQHVRLYDLNYKGCMSCMACKIKGKASNICCFKDELKPVLDEVAYADGIVLASPIYMGETTAMLHAFFERWTFPWLSYKDYSNTPPKHMPVVAIYTMNAAPEQMSFVEKGVGMSEWVIQLTMKDFTRICANNTYQVKNYGRYEFADGQAERKQAYKDAHWEEDLAKAREAGKRMAEKIIKTM